MSTINRDLLSDIATVIADLPAEHYSLPDNKTPFLDTSAALEHLNNYGFTQGHAYVVESGGKTAQRSVIRCIHHGKETLNTRKLTEEERKRPNTHVRGLGCPVYYNVNQYKKLGGQRLLTYKQDQLHNHPPAPDPFALQPYKSKRPSRKDALSKAEKLRGFIIYGDSKKIL